LIKRETAKMSTALPLQKQYDTYVTDESCSGTLYI